METPYDIQERSFVYACRVVDFCRPLFERTAILRELGRQLIRAGTSIGANLEEADVGESKADFRHKIGVARKEAKESRYWLRLISYTDAALKQRATPLIGETSEIIAILTTIKKNSE